MEMKIFAAVVIGSDSVEMKIFQIQPHKKLKVVNSVESHLELGKQAYTTGRIPLEEVEELCVVLKDFSRMMKEFGVNAYRVCCTSALRETVKRVLLVDYIEKKTGLKIDMLSNAEQRFIDYKSVASLGKEFERIIKDGTLFMDVGGSSVQMSLFDETKLISTQNLKLGNIRIANRITKLERLNSHFEELMKENIDNRLIGFKKLYIRERKVKNLIITGDYLIELLRGILPNQSIPCVPVSEYLRLYERISDENPEVIAEQYGIPIENAGLILPTAMIYKRVIEIMNAEYLWLPGLSLTDGIAYEYAENEKMLKSPHDFTADLISSARYIALRYQCSEEHIDQVEKLGLQIFDKMKKIHGLGERERLLLRLSVIFHGLGKFISLTDSGASAYHIIRATEFIGVSEDEREIIASTVRYNDEELPNYDDLKYYEGLSSEAYLVVAKLTAILRVANALDRSHLQKIKKAVISLKDKEGILSISVETRRDFSLEAGLFEQETELFEEVFNISPALKVKKSLN